MPSIGVPEAARTGPPKVTIKTTAASETSDASEANDRTPERENGGTTLLQRVNKPVEFGEYLDFLVDRPSGGRPAPCARPRKAVLYAHFSNEGRWMCHRGPENLWTGNEP